MPGVFDRLNKEIQDKQKEGGITPLDLAGLPPALRKIIETNVPAFQLRFFQHQPRRRRFPRHAANPLQNVEVAFERVGIGLQIVEGAYMVETYGRQGNGIEILGEVAFAAIMGDNHILWNFAASLRLSFSFKTIGSQIF